MNRNQFETSGIAATADDTTEVIISDDDRSLRHRFCPKCGNEANPGTSFCGACGTSLINPEALTDEPHDEPEIGEHWAEEGDESIIPDVTWDFSDWDDAIQGDLGAALLRNKIPHRWERTTLSTEPDYENQVDAILDEFCGLPNQDFSEVGNEWEDEGNREADDEVTWETSGWDSNTLGNFTSSLLAADIPHYWDGTTLITDAHYETRVDSIIDGDEVTWETSSWNSNTLGDFTSMLLEADIPHYWDGTTLITDAHYENRVEPIMDDIFGTHPDDGHQPRISGYASNSPSRGSGGKAGWIVAAMLVILAAVAIAFFAHHHSGSTSASAASGASQEPPTNLSGSGSINTGATTAQLNQAYSTGYFYGQHINGPESFCQSNKYSEVAQKLWTRFMRLVA